MTDSLDMFLKVEETFEDWKNTEIRLLEERAQIDAQLRSIKELLGKKSCQKEPPKSLKIKNLFYNFLSAFLKLVIQLIKGLMEVLSSDCVKSIAITVALIWILKHLSKTHSFGELVVGSIGFGIIVAIVWIVIHISSRYH